MAKARKLKSGSWNVRVFDGTDENGKKIMKSFTAATKAEAEFMAAEYAKERKEGKRKKPAEALTVEQAIKKYISLSETLSPTTLQAYKRILDHAFAAIMQRDVYDLTDADMQAAINAEAKRKSERYGTQITPKTVKNEWGLVSAALRTVCNRSYNVRLPKIQRPVEMLPEPSEVMAAIMGSPVELPCLLAMWMGLRMSEIRGLRCSSVRDGFLSVDQVTVDVDNVAVTKDSAKTAASKRRLRVPSYIMALINSMPHYKKWLSEPLRASDELLIKENRAYIYYHFEKAAQEKGLDLSFHDLRHLYASISISVLGLPSKVVQVSGGWSSSAVLDRVYSQSFARLQAQADDARDAFFSDLMGPELAQKVETEAEKN